MHPVYMQYIYQNAPEKFARYAKNIWGICGGGRTLEELALEGIKRTRKYFREIGAPITLDEVGIPKSAIPEIAAKTNIFPTSYSSLGKEDVVNILNLCAEE